VLRKYYSGKTRNNGRKLREKKLALTY